MFLPFLGCFLCDENERCANKDTTVFCDFEMSKSPIAAVAQIVYRGFTQARCLDYFDRFKWSLGIYCEASYFCAFGIDLARSYHSLRSDENSVNLPVDEICKVIVQKDQHSCDEVFELFEDIGLIPGKQNLKQESLKFC